MMLGKRFIVVLCFLILSSFIFGCSGNGRLEVVSLDYPKNFNTLTGRVVNMDMIIKNVGTEDCIINKVYSRQFWNQDEPGVTGMYSKNLNLILSPDQEYTIDLKPYLWDSDFVQSKEKKFEMVVEVDNPENCELEHSSLTGKINLEIDDSPVKNEENTVVIMDKTP